MELTYQSLRDLAQELPAFDAEEADMQAWITRPDVQRYLNYYHINFTAEFANLNYRFGSQSAGEFDIAFHHWQPPNAKGTVFLVHGYTDNVGTMQHALRFLLQSDWAVVCFDLPGHGFSSGDQGSIHSFDQYREVLFDTFNLFTDKTPQPWHGMGQSTGAMVILNYLGSYPDQDKLDKAALLAPLIRTHHWSRDRWLFYLINPIINNLVRVFSPSSHDEVFLDFVRHHDPLQQRRTPVVWVRAMRQWIKKFSEFNTQWRKVTVIQGDQDKTVDWEYNTTEIERVFPNAETLVVNGARHQLVNESIKYRQQVFQLLAKWLADK